MKGIGLELSFLRDKETNALENYSKIMDSGDYIQMERENLKITQEIQKPIKGIIYEQRTCLRHS
jgi:hypothetical protein